jgi:hypothetical protein
MERFLYESIGRKVKRKALPLTGCGDPKDCETLRLIHFLNSRLTDGGEVASLTRRLPFIFRKIPGINLRSLMGGGRFNDSSAS